MPRPRQYDDALRTRLLEAASVALADAGAEGVSLRAVAAAAGTTTAAVYTLFGGREALLDAVVAEGFARFGRVLDAVEPTDDAARDLFRLGLAYREYALAEPHFYRAMFGRPAAAGHDALAEPTFRRLEAATARVVEGEQGKEGLDGAQGAAHARALELWALVHGLVSLELGGHLPGDERERAERYAAALRHSRP